LGERREPGRQASELAGWLAGAQPKMGPPAQAGRLCASRDRCAPLQWRNNWIAAAAAAARRATPQAHPPATSGLAPPALARAPEASGLI